MSENIHEIQNYVVMVLIIIASFIMGFGVTYWTGSLIGGVMLGFVWMIMGYIIFKRFGIISV